MADFNVDVKHVLLFLNFMMKSPPKRLSPYLVIELCVLFEHFYHSPQQLFTSIRRIDNHRRVGQPVPLIIVSFHGDNDVRVFDQSLIHEEFEGIPQPDGVGLEQNEGHIFPGQVEHQLGTEGQEVDVLLRSPF